MSATLFHFSEDPSIELFVPQPVASDLGSEPMVWAIDAAHAPNYYLPRDCPRVTFGVSATTSAEDIECFFGHTAARRVIAIESNWLDRVRLARLYTLLSPRRELHTTGPRCGLLREQGGGEANPRRSDG